MLPPRVRPKQLYTSIQFPRSPFGTAVPTYLNQIVAFSLLGFQPNSHINTELLWKNDVRQHQPELPSATRRDSGQVNEGGAGWNQQSGGWMLLRPAHRDFPAQDGEWGSEEEMLLTGSAAQCRKGGADLPRRRQQQCQLQATYRSEDGEAPHHSTASVCNNRVLFN